MILLGYRTNGRPLIGATTMTIASCSGSEARRIYSNVLGPIRVTVAAEVPIRAAFKDAQAEIVLNLGETFGSRTWG
jgi:hypothetical protein